MNVFVGQVLVFFSCIDELIYLVLYIFVDHFSYLVVLVCIRQCCVRIVANNETIF